MKTAALLTASLILLVSFGFKEKIKPNYSDLNEWGLSGEVKEIKAFYYYQLDQDGDSSSSIVPEKWSRMSIAYYNMDGNMDSLKVYNSQDASPLTYLYMNKGRIQNIYLVSENDTALFVTKKWKSHYQYINEFWADSIVSSRETCYLDENYRIKETKRQHYHSEDGSLDFSTGEKIYFNASNQIDSIRSFVDGKMTDLVLNVDLELDQNKNPIRSSKKNGDDEPYLVIREFTYYE